MRRRRRFSRRRFGRRRGSAGRRLRVGVRF